MGSGNELVGADAKKRPSISITERKLEAFDEWVDDSDRFDSRAEAIRSLMTEALNSQPTTDLTPLEPPHDDVLADAYRTLCRAAYPNGKVRQETALRVCSNGPKNLSKQEVPDLVLHPLRTRGYIQQLSDPIYGRTAWEIAGWER